MAATSKSTSKTRAPKQVHGFTTLRGLSAAQAQGIKNFFAVSGETEEALIERFPSLNPEHGWTFLDALIREVETNRLAKMVDQPATVGQTSYLEALVALAEEHGQDNLATSGKAVLDDLTADRAKVSTAIERLKSRLAHYGVEFGSEPVETDPKAISEAEKVAGVPQEDPY